MPKSRGAAPTTPVYKVLVYKRHRSGIGQTLVKEEETKVKPGFEAGYFWDSTNSMWARWVDAKDE